MTRRPITQYILQYPGMGSPSLHCPLAKFTSAFWRELHRLLGNTASAEDTAALFRDRVFCLHGMPKSIVSDRDAKFTSAFWRELHRLLGIQLTMSTAYHPQSDGQTERMNRVLEDMLRHFINRHHNDWDQYLATAEFAINNAENVSVQNTPFMLNHGRHP